MPSMSTAQIAEFLRPPRHAILATNGRDGSPQLSPVWYLYEGGKLLISAGATTAKVRNLRRDPRLSVCIDGGHPDARYVVVYGRASLIEPDAPLQEQTRWRIIRHYYETEAEAQQYYDSIRSSKSVLIVVTPEKILSQDFT